MQDVAEIRRHDDLHQALQLVILQTGTSRLMDTLTDREKMYSEQFNTYFEKLSESRFFRQENKKVSVAAACWRNTELSTRSSNMWECLPAAPAASV